MRMLLLLGFAMITPLTGVQNEKNSEEKLTAWVQVDPWKKFDTNLIDGRKDILRRWDSEDLSLADSHDEADIIMSVMQRGLNLPYHQDQATVMLLVAVPELEEVMMFEGHSILLNYLPDAANNARERAEDWLETLPLLFPHE